MKRILILATLVGSAALLWTALHGGTFDPAELGDKSTLPVALRGLGSGVHAKAVRAEFVSESSITDAIDTELFIVNRSLTQPMKLKTIVVLGGDGINRVISTWNGLFDRVIPPLGEVVLPINRQIQNVRQRATPTRSPGDVASVVVTWEGPQEAMRLTAFIHQWEPTTSNSGYRGTSVVEGYNLTQ